MPAIVYMYASDIKYLGILLTMIDVLLNLCYHKLYLMVHQIP